MVLAAGAIGEATWLGVDVPKRGLRQSHEGSAKNAKKHAEHNDLAE
jgi:hypothetical protein